MRSSSHWKSACHGSKSTSLRSPEGPSPCRSSRRSSRWSEAKSVSVKRPVTSGFEATRETEPAEPGTTASASISAQVARRRLRRLAVDCRAHLRRRRARREPDTTVTPNGLPAAVADPASANAAANAARRRSGPHHRSARFDAGRAILHHPFGRSALRAVRLGHLAVVERLVERRPRRLPRPARPRAAKRPDASGFLDDLGRLVVADVRVERRRRGQASARRSARSCSRLASIPSTHFSANRRDALGEQLDRVEQVPRQQRHEDVQLEVALHAADRDRLRRCRSPAPRPASRPRG